MLKRLILLLIIFSIFQTTFAQKNASEYEIAYKKALQTFKSGDFEKAKLNLVPCAIITSNRHLFLIHFISMPFLPQNCRNILRQKLL